MGHTTSKGPKLSAIALLFVLTEIGLLILGGVTAGLAGVLLVLATFLVTFAWGLLAAITAAKNFEDAL